MVTYQHRAARLNLSFPLQFRSEDGAVPGHCLNLSESGLLGVFENPLDLWSRGEILLQFGNTAGWLLAKVARVADNEAGLAFAFRGEAERDLVRLLLLEAGKRSQLVGPPPF